MGIPGRQLRTLHLFAGAGGGILGDALLGHRCVCAVEKNAFCRSVLLARQRDRTLPRFPIWDDVKTFDGYPWQGKVDVVCGGFPCQDISQAGYGVGIRGKKSGLWTEFARIIGEIQPAGVFVENSPRLKSRGLDVVLGDLACLGYDAEWGVISASDTGGNHLRERIWISAYPHRTGRISVPYRYLSGNRWWELDPAEIPNPPGMFSHECHTDGEQLQPTILSKSGDGTRQEIPRSLGETNQPRVARVVDGMAHRVDRTTAIGNGQVPAVAATAWSILTNTAHVRHRDIWELED